MPDSIQPFLPFIFVVVANIVILAFRNHNYRKIKDSIIKRLERKNIKAVYLDTKVTLKATSFLSFQYEWKKAEVIIAEEMIFYLAYFSIFNYHAYSQVLHWHINEEAVIPRQIRYSALVKDIKITGGNLVIDSKYRHANLKVTIQDVISSGKVEVIRKILKIPHKHYQED